MSKTRTPEIVVDWRIEAVVNLIGIGAGAVAAYHAGQTGNWMPLAFVAACLTLVVVFVNSEQHGV